MTSFQLVALVLAVIGGVGMNMMMKYLSHLPSMPIYLLALVVALLSGSVYFFLTDGAIPIISGVDWWFIGGLGISFVVLNLGFLFLYQSGFSVSFIPLVTTGLQIICLTVLAFFLFGQAISWQMMMGMIFVLMGIGLMTMS
ncbi:MAG: hypothetical protein NZL83_03685 [Candidatus Absconditabacterales bacterium]|nr:hypothetical protein [Candidatus Absconditabacterales bacterium]